MGVICARNVLYKFGEKLFSGGGPEGPVEEIRTTGGPLEGRGVGDFYMLDRHTRKVRITEKKGRRKELSGTRKG